MFHSSPLSLIIIILVETEINGVKLIPRSDEMICGVAVEWNDKYTYKTPLSR